MKTRETGKSQVHTEVRTRRVASGMDRISSSAMLSEAADRMKKLDVDTLPVVEDNEIIGQITDRDVIRAVSAGLNPTTTPVKHALKVEEQDED